MINVDLPYCTVHIIKSLLTLPYPLLSTTALPLGLILVPIFKETSPECPSPQPLPAVQDRFLLGSLVGQDADPSSPLYQCVIVH